MIDMIDVIFITRNNTGADKFGQSFTPKVTETAMPKGGGCSDERGGAGGRCIERVEVTGAIAPGDHISGLQILHRETKWIKFNGTIIVCGKTTNGNKVLNNVGDTRTLLRARLRCGQEKTCDPVAVTGSKAPFTTMIDGGVIEEGGEMVESVPASLVMCEPAPESAYHSEIEAGGFSVIVLKECARES
jgi:hypothetical protein